MWIYENNDWPNFIWDSDFINSKLLLLRYDQGRLLGKMEGLGFELQREASLKILTNDVIKSSMIEGELLNLEEVRSSIARKLGLDIAGIIPSGRDVEGVVEMMLDATQKYNEPLTKERLFNWHSALFPTGRTGIHKIIVGGWRSKEAGPMQVVSGPIGKEKIHFEAPDADKIEQEMKTFIDWFEFNQEVDLVLKAGIAHFWFVTIHPFEDGNGRIARTLADMALARAEGTSDRFYSLSSQIQKERSTYYKQLEKQQRGTLDITDWLEWFIGCLGRSISNAEEILVSILFKSEFWRKLNQYRLNDRQKLIINKMQEADFKGFMNTSKYAKLSKCSPDTALRDIQGLLSYGAFIKNPGGGRSTSYRLPENINELH